MKPEPGPRFLLSQESHKTKADPDTENGASCPTLTPQNQAAYRCKHAADKNAHDRFNAHAAESITPGERVYNSLMHPHISIVQNNGRIGVGLDSEQATPEICWSRTASKRAPTALGDAVAALEKARTA